MLEKIVLNIRGKKIELSLEEAKELKDILADLFGTKEVVRHEYIPYYPYTPYWPDWTYRRWDYNYPYTTAGTYADDNSTVYGDTITFNLTK